MVDKDLEAPNVNYVKIRRVGQCIQTGYFSSFLFFFWDLAKQVAQQKVQVNSEATKSMMRPTKMKSRQV